MTRELILVGASVRAAAASARAAGRPVHAADLFADADLQALADQAIRVRNYPHGLPEAIAHFPVCPWMYSGAMENYPELIEHLASLRPLWGNAAETLRAVRDPFRLAAALRSAGFPYADVRDEPSGLPRHTDWLIKPKQSAGGRFVMPWNGDGRESLPDGTYLQRYVEGTPVSAAYVAAGGEARLLGVTRQLIGEAEFGAAGFRYVGNIVPGPFSADDIEQARQCGAALARAFDLVGLFGVDAILSERQFVPVEATWDRGTRGSAGRGRLFVPVEVNPRYTASMELLEAASGVRSVGLHVAACRDGILPHEDRPALPDPEKAWGKAIVFARQTCEAGEAFARLAAQRSCEMWYADIPRLGEIVPAGQPVTSCLARGRTAKEVDSRLRAAARAVYSALTPAATA